MRKKFIECLIKEARNDERIFLITPDLGFSILEGFQQEFPDRFLNTGIAEQNAIGVAAGLALSGKIVYVYSIVPFVTMRCFEQVRLDIAYMKTNVRIVGYGAGFTYGSAGATHHSIEDISIMRSLPNMTVCCPGDNLEVEAITKQSVLYQGPMYIRLGKWMNSNIQQESQNITIGKASTLTEGNDIALIATNTMLLSAKLLTDKLIANGKKPILISMHTIKPFDKEVILKLIEKNIPIVTIEEHNIIGGLGSTVAEVIADSGKGVKFKRIAIPDEFSHYVGDQEFIKEKFGLKNLEKEVYNLIQE